MTLKQARKVLGIGPDEDPKDRLDEFEMTRREMASNVQTAPPEAHAKTNKKRLAEYDAALAMVRGDISSNRSDDQEIQGVGLKFALWLLAILAVLGSLGGWAHHQHQEKLRVALEAKLNGLTEANTAAISEQEWEDSEALYEQIIALGSGPKISAVAAEVRQQIDLGKDAQRKEFVETGLAKAKKFYDNGDFDSAATAVRTVLDRYPEEQEVVDLGAEIQVAIDDQTRAHWREVISKAIAERNWSNASGGIASLREKLPGDLSIAELEKVMLAEQTKQQQELARARELMEAAMVRDNGEFDAEALRLITQAKELAPEDPKILEAFERIDGYTRTLRVPEDVPTLSAALAQLRSKDKVLLGEGTFEGGAWVAAGVEIEGVGGGKTIITGDILKNPVLTFGPNSAGAKISNLVFQAVGFDTGNERFAAVLVRGGAVEFSNCRFTRSSGHGLAVMDGGKVSAEKCRFTENAWEGASVRGAGSRLSLIACEARGNFGHGYEVWDEASAEIVDSTAAANSRNGLLLDSAGGSLVVRDNRFSGNREYGAVLASGTTGTFTNNECRENELGGLVVRQPAVKIQVSGNRFEKNGGPGLVLEAGVAAAAYTQNRSVSNRGRDRVEGIRFPIAN